MSEPQPPPTAPLPEKPRMFRFRVIPLTLAGSFGALCLMLLFFQNKLLFFPDRGLPPAAEMNVPGLEEVEFTASDGVTLVSWWLAPRERGRPVVLFCQGNAGSIEHRSDRAHDARENGWGILLLGYRGYGKSAGSPDEEGLYRDTRAALAWLRGRADVDPARIVYQGESLGCALAMELAVAEPPLCVVLEAPFASLKAIAAVHYPWLPTSILVRSRFDNLDAAARLARPLLVAHGTGDEVVPFAQGRAVFDAARGPKRFVELPAGHNDLSERGGREYRAAIRDFVEGAAPAK
ncbi:MAG: alpha/beta hydrolase [Candidatus Brocadiae bacterium]|nr:alpha/beta hydrolase [Candidatus Brocadiia bacterium]